MTTQCSGICGTTTDGLEDGSFWFCPDCAADTHHHALRLAKERIFELENVIRAIAQVGCMHIGSGDPVTQSNHVLLPWWGLNGVSKEEPEFFCKHDGSRHSLYCPAGMAIAALSIPRHYHGCPECYEKEDCVMGCALEADLGEHKGCPMGTYVVCSTCLLDAPESPADKNLVIT